VPLRSYEVRMTTTPGSPRPFRRVAITALVLAACFALYLQSWNRTPPPYRPDTGVAAGALDADAARDVLTELLDRVYTAFAYEDEGAIYDGLATAVASDLLTDLYLQRRAAQEAELEEGGTSVIMNIILDEMEILENAAQGYRIDAKWTVTGEVGHEDHRHERINAYSAQLVLGPSEGEWRLVDFDLNRIEREETPLIFFEGFE